MSNYRRIIVPRVPAFTDGPATKYKNRDFLTKSGAEDLAFSIRKTWEDLGYEANVWVEKLHWESREARGESYVIRSTMINGIPSQVRRA